ncbi:hypothetical protein R3P38DRAFT_114441 [Favolaschia claudopus]|uniref:Uncharacterized protein n=1 Tax=Favolaschia claudopus TaxID=2862362 RepID=A0AAV9ZW40_9AGAR
MALSRERGGARRCCVRARAVCSIDAINKHLRLERGSPRRRCLHQRPLTFAHQVAALRRALLCIRSCRFRFGGKLIEDVKMSVIKRTCGWCPGRRWRSGRGGGSTGTVRGRRFRKKMKLRVRDGSKRVSRSLGFSGATKGEQMPTWEDVHTRKPEKYLCVEEPPLSFSHSSPAIYSDSLSPFSSYSSNPTQASACRAVHRWDRWRRGCGEDQPKTAWSERLTEMRSYSHTPLTLPERVPRLRFGQPAVHRPRLERPFPLALPLSSQASLAFPIASDVLIARGGR